MPEKPEDLKWPDPPKEKKSKYSLKPKDLRISEENALKQVMLLLECYNIDVDELDNEAEEAEKTQKQTVEEAIDKIVNSVRLGQIEIYEDQGDVKVKLIIQRRSPNSTVKELVFSEMRWKNQTKMTTKGNQYKKMLSLLSSMCETDNGSIALEQLRSSDATIMEFLAVIFLSQ